MLFKKRFVQIEKPADCEAYRTYWEDTDETFEYWADKVTIYGYGPYAVREIEKTFDTETFNFNIEEIRRKNG